MNDFGASASALAVGNVSITSSGQTTPFGAPPYFMLIDKALRNEGTSYHYLPPAEFAAEDERLIDALWSGLSAVGKQVERGATWMTDAPFRETEEPIEPARAKGILAVEMEAAGLYACSQARARQVLCFAHVTNQMGRTEGDFEKREENGAAAAVQLIYGIARSWSQHLAAKDRRGQREPLT